MLNGREKSHPLKFTPWFCQNSWTFGSISYIISPSFCSLWRADKRKNVMNNFSGGIWLCSLQSPLRHLYYQALIVCIWKVWKLFSDISQWIIIAMKMVQLIKETDIEPICKHNRRTSLLQAQTAAFVGTHTE